MSVRRSEFLISLVYSCSYHRWVLVFYSGWLAAGWSVHIYRWKCICKHEDMYENELLLFLTA